jgi:hypothetical protein
MSADQELRDVSHLLGDRYTTERELGRGGMGTVYLARDLQLDRNVAIKVLPREFAADAMLRERFVRETRVAASFSHPNIVPVHAVEERDALLAFVMGFVEGESRSQRSRAPARSRRASACGCCRTSRMRTGAAWCTATSSRQHPAGARHRPSAADGFGVPRGGALSPAMRRVGEVVGTPEFMSPEQAAGEELDGAATCTRWDSRPTSGCWAGRVLG